MPKQKNKTDGPPADPYEGLKHGEQMVTHNSDVANISKQIAAFSAAQTPFRIYHGSTNSTQPRRFDRKRMVDTSGLNGVLRVDHKRKTCLVEPNVAMDELVAALLKHNLLPPVVMEFPGITVGGGFAGTAGESSGFKYGFFDRTVNWIEIVTPTGDVLNASETLHADLFHGAAGTLGTLGVVTLFELQLVDAKPYVELTYHHCSSTTDALATMSTAAEDPATDYIDGILFSPTRSVIVTGTLVASPTPATAPLVTFTRAADPWFYLHVDRNSDSYAATGGPVKFTTTIESYLFRYDRGAFWTGRYAYTYFLTPFNRISRYILDYFMHTRVMYHALHTSGHADKYVVQDCLLPWSGAEDFVRWVGKQMGTWPLWVCPIKREAGKGRAEVAMHPVLGGDAEKEGMFVNVGVWGPGPKGYGAFVATNRDLEAKVTELGGIKWLYAQGYASAREFWSVYDRGWYEALRAKFGARYLPDVYEKTAVDWPARLRERETWSGWARGVFWGVWPLSGVYGVLRTLGPGEYLLGK